MRKQSIPASYEKEFVPNCFTKKNKSPLVHLAVSLSRANWFSSFCKERVWRTSPLSFRRLPGAALPLQRHCTKTFAVLAALREINQAPSFKQPQTARKKISDLCFKNLCGLSDFALSYPKLCTIGAFLTYEKNHTGFTRKGIVPNCFTKKTNPNSLAFNASPPHVVANRPASLAGRCGNLPAPLF